MSNIPKTVDGVVLESRDERDEECVITFKTESILEKFILKFDRLHMDCHDHLYIYDGAHATGAYRVGIIFMVCNRILPNFLTFSTIEIITFSECKTCLTHLTSKT